MNTVLRNLLLGAFALSLTSLSTISMSLADVLYSSVPDITGQRENAYNSSWRGGSDLLSPFTLTFKAAIDEIKISSLFSQWWDQDVQKNYLEDGTSSVRIYDSSERILFDGTLKSPNYTFNPIYTQLYAGIVDYTVTSLVLDAGNYFLSLHDAVPSVFNDPTKYVKYANGGFETDGVTMGFVLEGKPVAVPGPIAGAGLPTIVAALSLLAWRRRRSAA